MKLPLFNKIIWKIAKEESQIQNACMKKKNACMQAKAKAIKKVTKLERGLLLANDKNTRGLMETWHASIA